MKSDQYPISNSESLIHAASELYGLKPGFCVLKSGDSTTSPSYIFLEPFEQIELSPNDRTGLLRIEKCLEEIKNNSDYITGTPLIAGLFSYEFLHELENVPHAKNDNYQIPALLFYRYRTIIRVQSSVATVFRINNSQPLWSASIERLIGAHSRGIQNETTLTSEELDDLTYDLCASHSLMSAREFKEKVQEIRAQILDGDVYQVNLSQQIASPTNLPPHTLFQLLTSHEQAEFGAYFQTSCGQSILSISPELFFQRLGSIVSVRPIKGTNPRWSSAEEDSNSSNSLLESEKNLAELAMIVDLMRNDLGKIALPASVSVDAFPKLFSLKMVHHLCANISAQISSDTNDLDIIRALFPSGSITGTPKIAAMKQISRLEGTARGPYCGAIGFFGKDISTFNVAIRTGVHADGVFRFQVGGGITIDSAPEDEYQETINKARAFTAALMQQKIQS